MKPTTYWKVTTTERLIKGICTIHPFLRLSYLFLRETGTSWSVLSEIYLMNIGTGAIRSICVRKFVDSFSGDTSIEEKQNSVQLDLYRDAHYIINDFKNSFERLSITLGAISEEHPDFFEVPSSLTSVYEEEEDTEDFVEENEDDYREDR